MDNQIPSFANRPVTGNIGNLPKKKKNSSMLVVIVTILIIVAVAGFILIRSRKQNKQTQATVAGTATEETTPMPSPTPQIDKQSVKIQVLNGTGMPGQAASVITDLTKAGFNPDNIQANNASDYDHSATTVATKSGFTGIVDDIKNALNSTFNNVSIDSAPLDDTNSYDVIITTGGKKYIAPTNTPTPEATETPSITPTATVTPTNISTPTAQ